MGRRTTTAIACVLAVLGGPAVSAAAHPAAPTTAAPTTAAPAAPATGTQAVTAAAVTTRSSPVPQPSPGVPPRPEPEPGPTPQPPAGAGNGDGRGGDADGKGPAAPSEKPGGLVEAAADADGNGNGGPGGGPGGDAAGEGAGPTDADGAGDGEQSLSDLRKDLADLHDRAESATDAYNAAETKAKAQRDRIDRLEGRTEATRKRLGELRKRAGALARAQYRTGGLPVTAQLVLSEHPEEFLRDAGLARRGQQAAKGLVTSLAETRDRLAGYTRDAEKRYAELEENRKERAAAKKRIEKQLKKAEKLTSRLAADERARLRELERRTAYTRQLRWLRTGVLAEIDSRASAQGRKAVEYATAQIGKDYEWGAEGPTTYDCSGLTMRAWEAAGVSVPRTSQEQWRQLPRVDIEDMRPGDLIVYKADAGHVGMYLGDGVMVHAPRTGRQITVEGAGSYPILGVVRPDK